jgi:hypothetical protein
MQMLRSRRCQCPWTRGALAALIIAQLLGIVDPDASCVALLLLGREGERAGCDARNAMRPGASAVVDGLAGKPRELARDDHIGPVRIV